MVGNNAKHIVLLSRSGVLKGKAKQQIDTLNDSGAAIVVRCCNVANRGDVDRLFEDLRDLPPVRGIIHGAMVLHVSKMSMITSFVLTVARMFSSRE